MSTAAGALPSQVDALVSAGAPRRVAAYIPDLFFSVRVTDVIRALGGLPDLVDSAAALWEALERWPALMLIDLRAGRLARRGASSQESTAHATHSDCGFRESRGHRRAARCAPGWL